MNYYHQVILDIKDYFFNYVFCEITMHWITITGAILVFGGMFLFYFSQKLRNRLNNNNLQQSISKMTHEVDQLVNSNNELHSNADQYEKNLSEKDETIHKLTEQVGKHNVAAEEYQKSLSEKDETIHRFTAQVDKLNAAAEEYQKNLSEKDETFHQLT